MSFTVEREFAIEDDTNKIHKIENNLLLRGNNVDNVEIGSTFVDIGTTFRFDIVNNRLGINTLAPTNFLDVNGGISISGTEIVDSGRNGSFTSLETTNGDIDIKKGNSPSLNFFNGGSLIYQLRYDPTANYFTIYEDGNTIDRLRILDNGGFEIVNITDNKIFTITNSGKVDILQDNLDMNNNDIVNVNTVSGINISGTNLTGTLQTAAQPNVTSVGTLTSLDISGDLTVDTDLFYVDSTNNKITITTDNTTGDDHQMLIKPSSNSGNSGGLEIRGHRNNSTTFNSSYIVFSNYDNDITTTHNFGKIVCRQSQTTLNYGDLIFCNYPDGVTESETMRMTRLGNVGINTSSPSHTLDVNGTINASLRYRISDDVVLTPNTLGSVIVNSSLTNVGTLTSLDMGGDINMNNNNITNANTVSGTTISGTNLTGTLQTASQPNVTSVGTLTTLNMGGNIDMGTNNITNATNITGTNLTGTLQTASQPNVTSVGTLTTLNMGGNIDMNDNNIIDLNSIQGTASQTNYFYINEPDGSGTLNSICSMSASNTYIIIDSTNNAVGDFKITKGIQTPSTAFSTFNSTPLFVIKNNGNTGIGKNGPDNKLDVNGDTNTDGVYKINNTEVLSNNTLGSGVTNSSLTNLGTLTELNVVGDIDLQTNNEVEIKNNTGDLNLHVQGNTNNTNNVNIWLNGINENQKKTLMLITPTGSWGKQDIHFCLNNLNDTSNTDINDKVLSILNNKTVEVTGGLTVNGDLTLVGDLDVEIVNSNNPVYNGITTTSQNISDNILTFLNWVDNQINTTYFSKPTQTQINFLIPGLYLIDYKIVFQQDDNGDRKTGIYIENNLGTLVNYYGTQSHRGHGNYTNEFSGSSIVNIPVANYKCSIFAHPEGAGNSLNVGGNNAATRNILNIYRLGNNY